MQERIWTDRQFDEMSWHDCHAHAIRIESGSHGAGTLVLDFDYIIEWVKLPGGGMRFRMLPARLTFHEVVNLRIRLDYATPAAALGPFSIQAIERHVEARERYQAQVWRIAINWPSGEFGFEASGYTQRGVGEPVLVDRQWLLPEERV